MKKQFIFIGLALLLSIPLWAQKKLELFDAVIGQWQYLRPESLSGVSWKGSEGFTHLREGELLFVNADNGKESAFLGLKAVNKALSDAQLPGLSSFYGYEWLNNEEMLLKPKNYYVVFAPEKKEVRYAIQLPGNAENMDFCAQAKAVAYTRGNNVFLATPEDTLAYVSDFKGEGFIAGQSVSRREFGISKGTFWSPDGTKLAYYVKDVRAVQDFPDPDYLETPAVAGTIKYPMAGDASEHVFLQVYDLAKEKVAATIEKDLKSEKYLTNIAWAPDAAEIYIAVLNRGQDHMSMNRYEATTGKKLAQLFSFKHEKWVEPEHAPLFLSDGKSFIYQTEQPTGYSHLYLYTEKGERKKILTSGEWVVTDVYGLGPKEEYLYFQATRESPLERHIYRVNLDNAQIRHISQGPGVHNASFAGDMAHWVDAYSSKEVPRRVVLRTAKGKEKASLIKAKNPLEEYDVGDIDIGTIKAADGKTDLYYRLIKPTDFDPEKKYPAIVYVYGGPHAQLITNSWLGGARMWNYYMAQQGYVMFTLDNRGSANRGFDFENIIHRHLGKAEALDQMEGVKFLESLDYVDTARIGLHGWSYGGHMTTRLMLEYPETFKVGVAGGPVIDWRLYEVMYGERYMDTPKENPEGYAESRLIEKADKLEGRLLLIHGGRDPVVVMQHSRLFIKEAISAGVPVNSFIYPDAEHNVGGYDRVHLMNKVTRYFDDFLK